MEDLSKFLIFIDSVLALFSVVALLICISTLKKALRLMINEFQG